MPIKKLIESAISEKSSYSENITDIERVLASPESIERRVQGIITIGAPEDIGAVLKLANSKSVLASTPFSIYPVSTGNNWGYGSGLPVSDAAVTVIMDLANLNNITFFDEDNGICALQPGVTQSILHQFLTQQNTDLMVPVTGAGPDCSVLANALERGYGITPCTDHFLAVTAIKGYLPSGDFYESSLSVMDESSEKYVDRTFKWKHGPYLDGIFTQSGNMIVTEITLVLERIPSGFDSFYMRFYDEDSFETAYGVVKTIFKHLSGVVGSINLMDKRRVAAMVADNPQGPENHINSTDEQIAEIARQHDVPEWTIVGTIYAPKGVSRAARKLIKKIAKGKADNVLFSEGMLIKIGKFVSDLFPVGPLKKAREQLKTLELGIQIMRGNPNQVALPLAYWRNPRVRPDRSNALNPAKDGCGLLWYAPLVPAKADVMLKYIDMVRTICSAHNIEPMVTFTNLTGYSTDSTIPIVFDRENPEAVTAAHNCLEALLAEGLKHGFVPYRLNINQQSKLDSSAPFWKVANQIAGVLDKNKILSRGRYNPATYEED
ncbi:FAD-binding oxidoreductase [Alteromonas sp. H39]|uniref:FAD-binding oxidoreductase n=1 Tax=Alteromonas sp. H39 TaxID=3389876 RepID=UPI0039E09AB7